jgi:hypothetical protein
MKKNPTQKSFKIKRFFADRAALTKPHVYRKFEIFWTNIASTMDCPNFKNGQKNGLGPLGIKYIRFGNLMNFEKTNKIEFQFLYLTHNPCSRIYKYRRKYNLQSSS